MIKLGIFGDQTTDPLLLAQLKSRQDVVLTGIYFSGNAPVPEGFQELASPEGLMDISDALLILSNKSVSSDLIRMILRKSKHLYLKTIPNINTRHIKELTDLEKEAGSNTFFYNPFNYIPWLNPNATNYERPFLINLRNSFEGATIKPAHELLLLVTAINRLAQSNYKKLDVFGMNEQGKQLVINMRLEYDNGSVVNVTVSQEKVAGYCELIDQSGIARYDFQMPLFDLYPQFNQEITCISDFIRIVQLQDKKGHHFYNFLNDLQILHEIREHLRFNEINF